MRRLTRSQHRPTAEGGATAGEKTTVSLWIFEGEETFLPTLKENLEAARPNMTLEITEIPEDQYVTKIETALAAGETPDIGYIYEPRWPRPRQSCRTTSRRPGRRGIRFVSTRGDV